MLQNILKDADIEKRWAVKHRELKAKHLLQRVEDYTRSHECRGLRRSAERERDVVNVAWALHQVSKEAEHKSLRCIDISQNVWRPASHSTHSLPTMTTGSEFFLYAPRDRVAIPREHFMALGWPDDVNLSKLSFSAQRNLTGEAMALPNIALATLAVAAALFRPPSQEHTD
eukprot:6492672-Amphidinium_carterae.4